MIWNSRHSQDLTAPSTVLFLAANPLQGQPLQLGEECRAIQRKMDEAAFRDKIRLVSHWAARPCDLLEALADHTPSVLHFSGHGTGYNGLYFQADNGQPVSVNSEALTEVMRAEGENVKLVVLNACFSEVQARGLIAHIPCVIGMPDLVDDGAAVVYAAYVYRALASAKSVAKAHQHGIAALALLRSHGQFRDVAQTEVTGTGSRAPNPTLLTRPDVNADQVYVVQPNGVCTSYAHVAQTRHRSVCVLTVRATLREFDERVIARVRAELRRLTNDMTLEIVDIDEGSVRLMLSLSPEGARALVAKQSAGELSEICGFGISAVEGQLGGSTEISNAESERPAVQRRAPKVLRSEGQVFGEIMATTPILHEVELQIAVAEGLLSRGEAKGFAEEALRRQQSPLALLVEQGRVSEESYQSLFAAALNDPVWRAEGHEGSASTYTMNAPPPAPGSSDPPFPVAAWDRYTSIRFLGQGGMGKVYLAVDNRLRREVAIKFVRGDDAEHVRRLIAEARTQAKVNHERICKVYEVDEVEGKVYIAMQYIHGKPLGRFAGELTLEQKVMLVRGAAEGIHEAHRVGIIHRDIKPSNIMVERGDDGEIRSYVMDFGLAHSAQEAGSTQTGAVLGTPRYMAPEQAHGSAAKLDRRADVYSLGATLYHVVTGEPPVPGETIAEVIANLVTVEPRPLRAHDPSLPADLEAIVAKCLEKERAARYDSARALADDLGRFLDGEPVLARPAGTWYRLRKRLIKHQRLVAVAAAALVVLGVAVGWAIKTSGEAAERERLARRFTERVDRIEAIARDSAQAPLHDIRADRRLIEERMAELRAEIREAGDVAAGPGHYALGRGYLALDDDDGALRELQEAWDIGYREPRVAYELAIATGHRYQQALLAADRIDEEDQRAAKRREVEQRYRGRVLGHLAAAAGSDVAPTQLVAALVAFYDGQFDAALRQLDALTAQPWDYEVPELRGDILLARGKQWRDRGERDLARRDFDASRAAYTAAATIGRSVPAIYQSIGDLEYAVLAAEFYEQGDVKPVVERVLAATGNVLAAMPDHHDALVLEARARRTLAEHEANGGSNVEDLLRQALGDAERAAKRVQDKPQALLEMAQIHRQWGDYQVKRHEDPSAHFAEAIRISNLIPQSDRDASYWANVGLTYSRWADAQDQRGVDSQHNRDETIDAYRRALKLDRRLLNVWNNLAAHGYNRASRPGARDPDGDLRDALAAAQAASEINPKHPVPHFYAGRIHVAMARRARSAGLDPDPEIEQALAEYRRGLEFSPKLPHLHNGVGGAHMLQASVAWERGQDPVPWLDQAEAAFRDAIAVAPEQAYGYDNVGEVEIQRAWFRRARGEDPRENTAAAIAAIQNALSRLPKDTTSLTDLAAAHAIQAGYDVEHARDPARSLDAAWDAIERAIAVSPKDVQAQVYRAELQGLTARHHARDGRGDPHEFAVAADAFAEETAVAGDNRDYQLMYGQFCVAWASFLRGTGGDPGDAIRRGLTAAERALGPGGASPDALILRAALALAQAESAGGAVQHAAATAAARDFAAAFDRNRALASRWKTQAEAAQRLAGSR